MLAGGDGGTVSVGRPLGVIGPSGCDVVGDIDAAAELGELGPGPLMLGGAVLPAGG